MSPEAKKINSLDKLILEKHRLHSFCNYQEKLIAYKIEELKYNFPEIINQQILPFDQEKNRNLSSLLDVVNEFVLSLAPEKFRSNKFVAIALKLVESIVIRGVNKRK